MGSVTMNKIHLYCYLSSLSFRGVSCRGVSPLSLEKTCSACALSLFQAISHSKKILLSFLKSPWLIRLIEISRVSLCSVLVVYTGHISFNQVWTFFPKHPPRGGCSCFLIRYNFRSLEGIWI